MFLILAFIMLMGLLVPQRSLLAPSGLYGAWYARNPALARVLEASGFTDIYTSPLALCAWGVFFLNLLLVMGDRAGTLKKRAGLPQPGGLPSPSTMGCRVARAPVSNSIELAEEVFKRKGFEVVRGAKGLYAVRYRWSPMATLVFHLSFLLMMAGGMFSAWTRFSATSLLAEGESFDGRSGPYLSPPSVRRFATPPSVRFTVEKVVPVAEGLTAVDITARIALPDGKRREAKVNHPFKSDSTSFVVLDLGVAPLLLLKDSGGAELDGAFVKMLPGSRNTERFSLGGVQMEARFFPDYSEEGGGPAGRSKEFRNPVLLIKAALVGGANPPAVLKLKPGESAGLGRNSLTFEELRYAVKFFVRRERGVWLVYTGFFLACTALAVRLYLYRREYAVAEDGGAVQIGGRAEYYPALFGEEFDRMVGALDARWSTGDRL